MGRRSLLYLLAVAICASPLSLAQNHSSEQVQVSPPPTRRAEPPSVNAGAAELEERGDALRMEKSYLDALDYYRAGLEKDSSNAKLHNKIGITELQMGRFPEAGKDFDRAIKLDRQFADAYNNRGVIYYLQKKYGKAIKEYEAAIKLRQDSGSFYSNLGAAYFSKRQFEKASLAYNDALRIDPDIFERTSHTGVQAQMSSPADRAHYYYVLAKLYAKAGVPDRSLQYLRRAMEEGYKGIDDVYKDNEFAGLRKDPRFTELMNARPMAIPE
ncbi:MAG TPA: tetratricopeptide repeat protein [Terriglobales bacterium]|nr:tetratricopeptide repeat protein [Terriglobales bacterium]